MTHTPHPHWNAKRFVLFQLAALVLLLSWIWPEGKHLWRLLDEPVFRVLNGSLGHWLPWDFVWALLSTRVADVLAATVMLWSLMDSRFVFPAPHLRKALVTFVSLLVVTLVVRTLFTRWIDGAGLQHASPSEQLGGAFRLSAAFPWMEDVMEIKDRSSRSFPGDHASVLILWMCFLGLFARGKQWLASMALGVFFILPRLVAGAHWLSDNLVGGGFVVLQTLAWGYHSMLGRWLARILDRLAVACLPLARRLPGIRLLAIVRTDA